MESDITDGVLEPGQQLPPVRTLAAELKVSPTTVSGAYRRLRDRGLVVGRGRQGTRVAPRPAAYRTRAATAQTGLVDAASGSPDPALLPRLDTALLAAARAEQAQYGDVLIIDELRAAAEADFERDGIDASHLSVTSGAMDAVERVLRVQGFRVGDRIGVEDPGHIPAHQVARTAGLELVPLPVDDEGITESGLAEGLERGLAAVLLTPRAQNPTGAALTDGRAAALSDILAAHPDVALIEDDHAGPVAGAPFRSVRASGPRWATIRSLGKAFGPDLRLAVVAGDRLTIDRLQTAVGNGPGWVSHILQRAAAHLMTDRESLGTVARAADVYRQRRSRLIDALASAGVEATGCSGLNVWLPTTDEQAMVEAARQAGFSIRAADPWRITSAPAVRVSITNLDGSDIDRLAVGLAVRPDRAVSSPV